MDELGSSAGRRYAVVFRERGGLVVAGCLEVADDRLRLSGGRGTGARTVEVPLAGIGEVRVGRQPEDRIHGYHTLVLERVKLPPLEVAPLGAGFLHEIADLLARLANEGPGTGRTLVVVVPLKSGCMERAGQLLAKGPPLDPSTLGLTGHHVYLHDREAIFVFEGPEVEAKVAQAMRTPAVWRAGIAWQGCIAGRPYVDRYSPAPAGDETPAYSWTASASSPEQ